jgi:cytochrome c-type biogenesis protein CcmH/NrfG
MSDPTTLSASENAEPDEFDRTSQAGWKWFTKFLLINVIVCALALLFVGALTVWS